MSISIAIVCEARADRETAAALADRILIEDSSINWVDSESIAYHREWRGLSRSDEYLPWKNVPRLALEHSVYVVGFFDGLPAHPDAVTAFKALRLLDSCKERPDAVLLQRDQDDDPNRRKGLEQARSEFRSQIPVVIGFAIVKRECWHLAGFDAIDQTEIDCFEQVRCDLGFNPCLQSHELTAKRDHHKRSAKRVLGELTHGDHDREMECIQKPELSYLSSRGNDNGLADFLSEVRQHIVPLFSGRMDPSASD